MKYFLWLLPVVLLIFSSCKEEKPPTPIEYHYEYFPFEVGNTYIYLIDSISRQEPEVGEVYIDTFQYQLKEVFESKFKDNTGNDAVRIEQYTRTNDTLPWKLWKVETASFTVDEVFRTHGTKTYRKLIFPVINGSVWDGNAFNIDPPENYRYQQVHQPLQLGELNFNSTLTVHQVEDSNFVFVDVYGLEKYAKGVGLIWQENRFYEVQQDKKEGYSRKKRLLEYQIQ